MGSSCSVEQSASCSPNGRSAYKQPKPQQSFQSNSAKHSDGCPKAATPNRFVSVIDKDITPPTKSKGTPTNRPRELSIDSCVAVSSVCDEHSLDDGGASPSNSFNSSRISPKHRMNVSFVHSNDVVIPEEDLVMTHGAQKASPRCPGSWSKRSRSVAGVLSNSVERYKQ